VSQQQHVYIFLLPLAFCIVHHPTHLNFIIRLVFGEEYRSWRSSLSNYHRIPDRSNHSTQHPVPQHYETILFPQFVGPSFAPVRTERMYNSLLKWAGEFNKYKNLIPKHILMCKGNWHCISSDISVVMNLFRFTCTRLYPVLVWNVRDHTLCVCVCVCVCVCEGHIKCALWIVSLCTLTRPVRHVDDLAPDPVSHFLSTEIDRELARSRSVAALNISR